MTREQQPGWMDQTTYELVFHNTPRLCVDLAVVSDEGLLLSKRSIEPFKGLWHLPGGRVNYKESLDEAVSRVAKAELGVEVKEKERLGIQEFLDDGEYIHSVSIVYGVRLVSHDFRPNSQTNELRFFKTIPQEMHPYHEQFLMNEGKNILKQVN